MNYILVQSKDSQVFENAVLAATAVSFFAFYNSHFGYEIKPEFNNERKPIGYRVRVTDIDGFGNGYLAQGTK